ncbi:MAG TPA: site-2 protease family protein [Clostridiales bacterium]|nr:site-2 protease family protein [Clostridiales bacterium]
MRNSKTSIKFHPILLLAVFLFFAAGHGIEFICAFVSISIHEAAHIFAASLMGLKIYNVNIHLAGLNAQIEENYCGTWQKIIMYICGPITNVLLFGAVAVIKAYFEKLKYESPDLVITFLRVNIYLAVFNIIPILPLDGGRILCEILTRNKGLFAAHKYMRIISFIILGFFFIIGVIQAFYYYNFNILLIGLYILFIMKSINQEAAFMNIKQLLYRRSRILKKGVYPARSLVVMDNVPMGEVVKNMDFDGFHIVYVLDDKFKLINTLTEQDIIDGLIENDGEITIGEFMVNKVG